MDKIKVLLETDPGDDIDDALAIAYLLNSGYFEIVGVVTSFKDTVTRAKIVKKLCVLNGKNIPVYAGFGLPLKKEIPQSQEINQYTGDLEDELYRPDCTDPQKAVDFIIDCCNRYRDELTVLGIAPLTTLSRAFIKDKNALSKVGRVVIMGGCFDSNYPEWNMYCDSDSAKIVYENAKNLSCIGVDVTSQTKLTEEQSRIIENDGRNGFYRYVGELVKMWRASHDGDRPTLHDVLAACRIVFPNVCTMKKERLTICTDKEKSGSVVRGTGQEVSYAVSFDKPAFMKEFMRVWESV